MPNHQKAPQQTIPGTRQADVTSEPRRETHQPVLDLVLPIFNKNLQQNKFDTDQEPEADTFTDGSTI